MEYSLSNEFLEVKVSSTGGAMTSIKSKDGLEYLWQGDPAYWANQAPLLFPICGSIRENQASVGDHRQMQMNRHGIVRDREFDCEQQSMHSVTMAVRSDEEMLEQFPFEVKFSVTYTLEGHSVIQTFTVENLEEEEMLPFFVGGDVQRSRAAHGNRAVEFAEAQGLLKGDKAPAIKLRSVCGGCGYL